MITNIIFRHSDSPITSDKPHYENLLPEGWTITTLGEIFQHNNGKQKSSSNKEGRLLKYITTSNVYWGEFDLSNVKEMFFTNNELEKCTVTKGDLLVCEGGDVGRSAIWNYEYPICIQNHLHRLRSWLPVCTEYFFYSLMYNKFKNLIKGKGIGLMSLSSNDLHNIPINLPPVNEQKRIVAEINRWFDLFKSIENNTDNLNTLIKTTKSKVLDLAIHGKLVPQDPTDEPATELLKRINPNAEITSDNGHYQKMPEGWVITPMQTLCALVDGEKQNGIERINLDVKFLRGEREAKVLTSGKYTAANTLLILVDGENSGEVFRAPVDGYQGSTFKQLSIHEEMYTDYVLQVINLHRKTLRENKVGSAIPHLNKKLFKAINVPIPPYEEQKRIVNAINQTFTILDKIMENL